MSRWDLLGISDELDEIINDFAYLASYHRESHPANTGDVSQVLSQPLATQLRCYFQQTASDWYGIAELEKLQTIRSDGRSGYRSEGIKSPRYYELASAMADRVFLVTRTGCQVPAIEQSIRMGTSGQLLNLVEVNENCSHITLLYGWHEYGSIPSIETHVHILANAVCISEGSTNPATVHAHPPNLVSLGRHRRIAGSFERFNALVYSQIEGLNRNYRGLIGIVPYFQSGTAALVENSLESIRKHRLVLWMNHGVIVREHNIRRAYTLLAYAEECAKAAIFTLDFGAVGLPIGELQPFLRDNGLEQAYKALSQDA